MRAFRRFVVTLMLVAQVTAGAFAHVPKSHVADATPPCHSHALPDCCAGGDCQCAGATAMPSAPALFVTYSRPDPARAALFAEPPTTQSLVLLRPPISPLPS